MTRTGKVTEDLSYYLKQPQSGKIRFSMKKHKVHPTLWDLGYKGLEVYIK